VKEAQKDKYCRFLVIGGSKEVDLIEVEIEWWLREAKVVCGGMEKC
jgi:hypothetical protein